jgi:hypothetical protein
LTLFDQAVPIVKTPAAAFVEWREVLEPAPEAGEEQTMTAWRNRRERPAYVKVGRHVFYRPSDIRKWLESALYSQVRPLHKQRAARLA